jgi:hypothetical protein
VDPAKRLRCRPAAALASIRESWEPETTANNLSMIREARARNREMVAWADELERELRTAAANRPED